MAKILVDTAVFPKEATNLGQIDTMLLGYAKICSSRSVTATGSLVATDRLIVVTGTGDVVLTLPSANAVGSGKCQEVVVKNIKSSGTLTLQRAGSDSIYLYGGTTPQTNTNISTGVAMVLFADGSASWIVTV